MKDGTYFEVMQDNLRGEQERRKMQERLQSLRGMILKGGPQGEAAKKVLFKEFGQQALGMIVELEREAKKKKR